ncbi:hypothetical protein Nepgr_022872 [Nepenthes gracilis]|uniref:Uncharacterized protein n=1 Tax=Nepenthes gracilis TaxID=150966 RepID=A0AAD3XYK0_NEPGR|nr:hypothetical protein Nepgr_022872 [Nepenthes gracilis]
MDAARSSTVSSPDALDSISATVCSQSPPFGVSAHSDPLRGAVEVKPNNSSNTGSSGKSNPPPGISWAQVAKGDNFSFGALKFFPPLAELDLDSPMLPPAEVKQQCVEVDRANPLPPKIRILTEAAELALSVEVEIIYHSKPARNSTSVQYTQKHVPMNRDFGVDRMCAATCLHSELVPENEGGGGQSASLASPTAVKLQAPTPGLVDGLGVEMEIDDLGLNVAPFGVVGVQMDLFWLLMRIHMSWTLPLVRWINLMGLCLRFLL